VRGFEEFGAQARRNESGVNSEAAEVCSHGLLGSNSVGMHVLPRCEDIAMGAGQSRLSFFPDD
jgi:hypothetical protein